MKIAVLSRHGRLLALCGLSAALHLLLLDLLVRHGAGNPAAQPDADAPLAVRLAPAATTVTTGHALPAASPVPAAPAPRLKPVPLPASTEGEVPSPPPVPLANQPVADTSTASPAGGDSPDQLSTPGMQPRYQLKPPAAARLVYRVSTGKGTGAPAQTAFLDWRPDGGSYSLDMDGVLGRRSSSGAIGDEGIVPANAQEHQGEHALVTSFDSDRHRVILPDGSEASDQTGTLDGATLWVWLASVGNGFARQLHGGISVNVADADGVHALSFQVVGEEEVDTGLGPIKAWHLAQFARPGEARVDAWLAPEQDWLPVQLRVTRPDGSVATQVLQRKEVAGAP